MGSPSENVSYLAVCGFLTSESQNLSKQAEHVKEKSRFLIFVVVTNQ